MDAEEMNCVCIPGLEGQDLFVEFLEVRPVGRIGAESLVEELLDRGLFHHTFVLPPKNSRHGDDGFVLRTGDHIAGKGSRRSRYRLYGADVAFQAKSVRMGSSFMARSG